MNKRFWKEGVVVAFLALIPICFAVLRLATRKYVFSALTTLSCAALSLSPLWSGGWRWSQLILPTALVVSAIGDYFMAHKSGHAEIYRLGIAGFLLAHALFIVHCCTQWRPRAWIAVVGLILLAGYGAYLVCRVLPGIPKLLKLPAALYTLISVAGFTMSLMTRNPLYIVGIALLLFSDTMIAEHDFAGNRAAGALILPTYYLSQMLVALSASFSIRLPF